MPHLPHVLHDHFSSFNQSTVDRAKMRAARDALAARLFFLVVLSLPKRWFFSYNFLDTATSLGAITNIELASEKLRSGRAHSNRVLSRTIGELA